MMIWTCRLVEDFDRLYLAAPGMTGMDGPRPETIHPWPMASARLLSHTRHTWFCRVYFNLQNDEVEEIRELNAAYPY